jgi:hypothetical protein
MPPRFVHSPEEAIDGAAAVDGAACAVGGDATVATTKKLTAIATRETTRIDRLTGRYEVTFWV